MSQSGYKPLDETSYWEARNSYKKLYESGELKEKYPDLSGDWLRDMKTFLENEKTIEKWDVDVENPKDLDQKEGNGSIWYDKK